MKTLAISIGELLLAVVGIVFILGEPSDNVPENMFIPVLVASKALGFAIFYLIYRIEKKLGNIN